MRRTLSPVFHDALVDGGYLGTFQVDFTSDLIQLSGSAANAVGLSRKEGAKGTSLTTFYRAIHPDDMCQLIEMQRRYPAKGGRWVFRSRALNHLSTGEPYTWIEKHFTVKVDVNGVALSASGIMLDVSALVKSGQRPASCAWEPHDPEDPANRRLRLIDGDKDDD